MSAKSTASPSHGCAAGVYTSPILLPLVAHILGSIGALDKLQGFAADFGRAFYQRPASPDEVIQLQAGRFRVDDLLKLDDNEVVPFWAGKDLDYSLV